MRVLITSDLTHADNNQKILKQLASDIQQAAPDLFIIAGNIGEPLASFDQNLSLFDNLSCPKALVTGNKDIWHRSGDLNSQQLWEQGLPDLIYAHGFTWLEQENLVIDRIGICGTMAWYDYSSRDAKLGYSVEQYEELKGLVNHDSQHIDWPWSDREFAAYLQENFLPRLDALEQDRQIDHMLVVTHTPVFQEGCVHIQDDAQWRFGTAYTFNLTLGRAIAPKAKIRHIVSGHLHNGGQWKQTFGNNTFKINIVGRGNDGPLYTTLDI